MWAQWVHSTPRPCCIASSCHALHACTKFPKDNPILSQVVVWKGLNPKAPNTQLSSNLDPLDSTTSVFQELFPPISCALGGKDEDLRFPTPFAMRRAHCRSTTSGSPPGSGGCANVFCNSLAMVMQLHLRSQFPFAKSGLSRIPRCENSDCFPISAIACIHGTLEFHCHSFTNGKRQNSIKASLVTSPSSFDSKDSDRLASTSPNQFRLLPGEQLSEGSSTGS